MKKVFVILGLVAMMIAGLGRGGIQINATEYPEFEDALPAKPAV